MTDLAEFLLARIAEDESVARGLASERDANTGRPGAQYYYDDADLDAYVDRDYRENMVRVGITRVLAECEAKRGVVELHAVLDEGAYCYEDGSRSPCPTLRLLALPYADHPDYRSEWRP